MTDWEANERILLFDGVCNMCNGVVQFVIKHDPHGLFKFASLQSETGQRILDHFGLNSPTFDTFVYVRSAKAYTRSDAALLVARDLGQPYKILSFLTIVPRALRNGVYNMVARSRYSLFGRKSECMIPTPELRKRFL